MTLFTPERRRPGAGAAGRAGAAVLLALVALTTTTVAPAAAAGGTFRQVLCSDPSTDGAINEAGKVDGLTALGTAGAWRPDLAATATCAPAGAMDLARAVTLGPASAATVGSGAWAALRYELTEPGLTLQSGRLYRAVQEATSPDDVTVIQHAGADASDPRGTPSNGWDFWLAQSTSSNDAGDLTQPWSSRNRVPLTVANNTFTITARCDASPPSTCTDAAMAWRYALFGAQLWIRDDADPQVSSVRGGLADGDPTNGDLQFTASDVGAGVYRAKVMLGNTVVHEQHVDPDSTRCRDLAPDNIDDYEFADRRPCPPEASVDLNWDTRDVPDGPQDVRVLIEDAAGNQTVVVERQATFDHVADPAPVDGAPPLVTGDAALGKTLQSVRGTWANADSFDVTWERCNADGQFCVTLPWVGASSYTTTEDDVGKRLRITVTAKNRIGESATLTSAPSPIVARAATAPTPTAPAGGANASPLAPSPAATVFTIPGAVGARGADGVHGRNATPNGARATSRARLTLQAGSRTTVRRGFTKRTKLGGRLTDEAGRPIGGARVRIVERRAAAGAREKLLAQVTTAADGSFTYTAGSGPSRAIIAAYRVFQSDATDTVRAQVRLLVKAALSLRVRAAKPGRTTWLTGRLKHLPRAGVQLEIQARDGKRWRTFDTTRTRKGGTFRFGYRFKRTAAGRRFALRVVVVSPTYPFARGTSPARRIRVPR